MNTEKIKEYNKKMRSALDDGDYRLARRTTNSFFGELLNDAVNGIGNLITSRREAKERERERQEQLRREKEAAERRRKIIKIFLIAVIIAGVVICAFIVLNNILGKSNVTAEKSTNIIEGESLTDRYVENKINEVITIDSADKESADKRNYFTSVKGFYKELFARIKDISQSTNRLYTVSYSIFTFWLGLSGIFLITSLLRVIIAIFNRKYLRKVGSGLLSSFLIFVSVSIQYYAFRRILERLVTEVNISNALTIISFALFVFSNITIIVLLRAKNKKANWGTVFKMIITVIVIYIPVIILIGRY
jgi:hypothetical protein